MDIGLAEALDDLCTEIHRRGDDPMTAVHVDPRLYDLVAGARRAAGRRGPLLLLGLELVRDERVATDRFRIR
ncbi:MAG TPA: hypothetical protein VFC31_01910 [Candidatus Limnocylindria bacterium]|nr:hypothetical protein [Candidatus Limnocylindria bacterium]